MRAKLVALAVIILFVIGPSMALCAEPAKIGIVDYQKIMEKSAMGAQVMDKLKTEHEKRNAQLEERESSIKNLENALKNQAQFLKPEAKEEKERQFRIEVSDLNAYRKKYVEELKQLEYELVSGIQKTMLEVVDEMGKKEQYLMIIERTEGGIIYNLDSINITDQVIKAMDAKKPKK